MVLTDSTNGKQTGLGFFLGITTNNVAETCALVLGLQEAIQRGYRRVLVFTDSELLQRQMTGVYRVKDPQLQLLHILVRQLVGGLEYFEIRHVPRQENKAADRLANQAIAQELKRHPKPKHKAVSSPKTSLQPTFGFI